MFFYCYDHLAQDIVPPETLHLNTILTLLYLEGLSPYVQGIFWDSDVIMVVQVDRFLKNAKNDDVIVAPWR